MAITSRRFEGPGLGRAAEAVEQRHLAEQVAALPSARSPTRARRSTCWRWRCGRRRRRTARSGSSPSMKQHVAAAAATRSSVAATSESSSSGRDPRKSSTRRAGNDPPRTGSYLHACRWWRVSRRQGAICRCATIAPYPGGTSSPFLLGSSMSFDVGDKVVYPAPRCGHHREAGEDRSPSVRSVSTSCSGWPTATSP